MKDKTEDTITPIDLQACVLRAAASYARGVRADMVRLVGPGRASLLWAFDADEPVSPRAVVRLVAAQRATQAVHLFLVAGEAVVVGRDLPRGLVYAVSLPSFEEVEAEGHRAHRIDGALIPALRANRGGIRGKHRG